jgi:hypothetical protein
VRQTTLLFAIHTDGASAIVMIAEIDSEPPVLAVVVAPETD